MGDGRRQGLGEGGYAHPQSPGIMVTQRLNWSKPFSRAEQRVPTKREGAFPTAPAASGWGPTTAGGFGSWILDIAFATEEARRYESRVAAVGDVLWVCCQGCYGQVSPVKREGGQAVQFRPGCS
jgi:hypothetical protein